MINGHGDDIHNYSEVRCNFSSNIYAGFSHDGLFEHLRNSMHLITNYPEPSPISLEKRIAEINEVDANCIMVTNGATEAIYLIANRFKDYMPVVPQPTFSEYSDACELNRCQMSETTKRNIWWLCVPNNPTGSVMSKSELIDKVSTNPNDIFVVDASYVAYTDKETLGLDETIRFDNVLMLRSMTKDYGVPGLRLGYVVGNVDLLKKVRETRMPWSVNALAIEAGHYLLAHRNEYRIPLETLIAERRRVENKLNAMGITTSVSDTHILLCRLPNRNANELKEYLISNHGILIRDASNFPTLLPQHFRIAVQTKAENNQLIKALKQWI